MGRFFCLMTEMPDLPVFRKLAGLLSKRTVILKSIPLVYSHEQSYLFLFARSKKAIANATSSTYFCVNICVKMATNLDIDPKLLEEALEIGGLKTKKATVNRALEEFIQRRKQKDILSLFGSIVYDPGYDYKTYRNRK